MIQDKTKKLGNTDRLGKTDDFDFKKIRGRREFFDEVLKYVNEKEEVDRSKLLAYFQYTTGATQTTIYQALEILTNLDLIKCSERGLGGGSYEITYQSVRGKK